MLISELPAEILDFIFELFVPYANRGVKPNAYLVTLCNVCSLWRQVALQDPFLWNNLHLPLSETAFQWVKCMLSRSGSAPLHVFVTKYREQISLGEMGMNDWSSKFLKLIRGHSQRWRTLEIDVPEAAIDLTPIWKGQAPMLQRLVVSALAFISNARDRPPVLPQILPTNDHLIYLNLSRFPVRWDQWNCTSITELNLGSFSRREPGPSRTELCKILSLLSKQLRELSIMGPWQPTPDHVPGFPPVVLEALTSFTTFRWGWPVEEVLLTCTFPVLEHVDTELPLGGLSTCLISRLNETPPLLQSVKRLSVDIEDGLDVFMEQIQLVFPQASHIELGYGLEKFNKSSLHFLSNWPCMDRLDIYEASLVEIKEILVTRYEHYPTPLLGLKLDRALGPLYRADYEWITSRVKCLIIEQVEIMCNGISKSLPFEDIYIIPQGVV
ncbi:hypothetical protein M408DRAFT_175795 [Serendipita vermifera MAFF 305830]|uniref:F-box domain-containing protein n=1 Tax=Serendipita vermifera MAFF 305830 TaxID=933852 RepID=A0A0C2WKX0_SERVB|nr:hypothetical protein M408DRAFT_175795 [Serendipita vermifera MAFF 305830]